MEEERGREKETKILILKLYSFRENDDEVGVGEIDDRVREIVFDICFFAQSMYRTVDVRAQSASRLILYNSLTRIVIQVTN